MNPVRYSQQLKWYSELPKAKKTRLDLITKFALDCTIQPLEDLEGERLLRRSLRLASEEERRFHQKEYERSIDRILSYPLTDTVKLANLIRSFLFEIESGEIVVSDIFYIPSNSEPTSSERKIIEGLPDFEKIIEILSYAQDLLHLYYDSLSEKQKGAQVKKTVVEFPIKKINEDPLRLLAWQIISSSGLMELYLSGTSHKIDTKYHAWCRAIQVHLGIEKGFTPGNKKEIDNYARNSNLKSGFYKEYKYFTDHINNKSSFVRSLLPKDGINNVWKKNVIICSNYNSQVIDFLQEFPDYNNK
jgi:hypothetical protein